MTEKNRRTKDERRVTKTGDTNNETKQNNKWLLSISLEMQFPIWPPKFVGLYVAGAGSAP
eukprot:2372330-Amphidinium_carterae.2